MPITPEEFVLAQLGGSVVSSFTNLYNSAQQRKLQERLHFDSQRFQRESQAEAFRNQEYLLHLAHDHQDWLLRETHGHQERLISKSDDLGRARDAEAHERQKELLVFRDMLQNWPLANSYLELHPAEVSVDTQPLLLLVAPIAGDAEIATTHQLALDELRGFLHREYSSAPGSKRPLRVIMDNWKSNGLRGDGAMLSLFYFLKGLPTAVIDPHLSADGQLLTLRMGYWSVGHERYVYEPYIRLSTKSSRREQLLPLLYSWYAVLAATVADYDFLLRSFGEVTPRLPYLRSPLPYASAALAAQQEKELSHLASAYRMLSEVDSDRSAEAALVVSEDLLTHRERAGANRFYDLALEFALKAVDDGVPPADDPLLTLLGKRPGARIARRLLDHSRRLVEAAPRSNTFPWK